MDFVPPKAMPKLILSILDQTFVNRTMIVPLFGVTAPSSLFFQCFPAEIWAIIQIILFQCKQSNAYLTHMLTVHNSHYTLKGNYSLLNTYLEKRFNGGEKSTRIHTLGFQTKINKNIQLNVWHAYKMKKMHICI